MKPYIFTRGEDVVLSLDVIAGDPLIVTEISAKMRAIAPGRTTISPTAPVAATFTVTARAANGDIPAGWNLVADSTLLAVGRYGADARLVFGAKVITEMALVEIKQGAT